MNWRSVIMKYDFYSWILSLVHAVAGIHDVKSVSAVVRLTAAGAPVPRSKDQAFPVWGNVNGTFQGPENFSGMGMVFLMTCPSKHFLWDHDFTIQPRAPKTFYF